LAFLLFRSEITPYFYSKQGENFISLLWRAQFW